MEKIIKSNVEKEFLFQELIKNHIELDITTQKKQNFKGYLTHYDLSKNRLTIKHDYTMNLSQYTKIEVFYSFRENRHRFSTYITDIIDEKTFICKIPSEIIRNLQRKFERIKPEEIEEIEIHYKGIRKVLEFPTTEKFSPFSFSKYGKKAVISIKDLIEMFKKKMSIFSNNYIVMLRGKQPTTLEEFLIIKTGKSFYLPNTFKNFPDKLMYDSSLIITYEDLFEYYRLIGIKESLIKTKINALMKLKQGKNILSELYYPVIYRKFVISYIYLMNTIEKGKIISFGTIEKLGEFANILIATLIKMGYFETLETEIAKTTLIDISAGGLLFASGDKQLWDTLKEGDEVKVRFKLKDKIFFLDSIIKRKFVKDKNNYFGVQFIKLSSNMIKELENLLYNKGA